jgi:S-adenosylmethionine:diacylglycerol 3-amino-3-carboxypropyl transferase
MNRIYFAQIREDGRLERLLLARQKPSRIVCIGSGGCTALSLLERDVEVVYSVDSNPAQCALVELKKAALTRLDRSSFLAFIGEAASDDRIDVYRTKLRTSLPGYAREHWDAHESDVAVGINQCGATERFYRFVGGKVRSGVCPDEVWRKLFACRTIAEQIELYDRHFANDSWRTAVRVLLSKTSHLAFFPREMFDRATEHDFGAFFASQFELEARSKPLSDNYFLSQLLFGTYLMDEPQGMPHYLTEAGYETARAHADKLAIVPMPVEKFLLEAGGIEAFFLSNVFDWLTDAGSARLGEVIVRSGARRASILYRNMLSAHPLRGPLANRFIRHDELSAELADLERSMMYRRISAGELS